MMGIEIIAEIVTTEQVIIALIIVSCIGAIEAGIIGGLVSNAGSLKKLFGMSTKSNNPPNDTCKKRDPTTNNPNNQKGL